MDIALLVIFALMLFYGIAKGFAKLFIGVINGITTILAITFFSKPLCSIILQNFELPYFVGMIISIITLVLIIAIITTVVIWAFEKIISALHIGIYNRLLGGLMSLIATHLVITLFIVIASVADIQQINQSLENSKICNITHKINHGVLKNILGVTIDNTMKEYIDNF